MRATALVGVCLMSLACDPGPSTQPVFAVLDEGSGDALLTELPHTDGSHWAYEVFSDYGNGLSELGTSEVVLQGSVELDGVTVQRELSGEDIAWVEHRADGVLVHGFGTKDGVGRYSSPAMLLSYPLREGRRWTTGDDDTPERFTFIVTGVVELDLPAGRFSCVRVDSLDVEQGDPTTRFYAEGIGLVAREQIGNGAEYRTELTAYSLPEVAP